MDSKRSSCHAVLLVALFAGGCADLAGPESASWTKPGAMPNDLESDRGACQRRATSPVIYNSKGMLVFPAGVDEARFAGCMSELGYTRTTAGSS
jgi:hypothetical protein